MMSLTVTVCPLCGSPQSSLFDQRTFRSQQVDNRLCSNCGLVYQSPRMSDEELSVFYEQEYRQLYQGSSEPAAKDLAVQRRRAEALQAFVKDQYSNISSHLDIGSSSGLLLQHFKDTFGCEPVGIEPGDAYRNYARQQGLTVYASLDELMGVHPVSFDLISLAHVLEHIPQPVQYLDNLRHNLLHPHGHMLVEVPNLYAHDCFELAHLVSYSRHTLTQTLHRAGFEIVALQEHGQPRSRIIPLYLTVLARPAPGNSSQETHQIIPEKAVRRKRQWGLFHRRLLSRLFPRQVWIPVLES